MRTALAVIAITASAVGGSAQAQPGAERLSDSQYIALARCVGLVSGSGQDASETMHSLREAGRGRASHVRERALSTRHQAASEIRNASGVDADRLAAERDACAAG